MNSLKWLVATIGVIVCFGCLLVSAHYGDPLESLIFLIFLIVEIFIANKTIFEDWNE